jgi:membrane protein YqaA with SNARE-associated domain
MFPYMKTPAKKIYDWAAQKANTPFAPFWLGCVFLLELVFFLPLDAILVLFCLENPNRRFLYAIIATIASTISGLAGYALGYLAWDAISPFVLGHLISSDFFTRICDQYHNLQNLAVFVGSFLPIPFKAVALSAGVCKLSLLPFLAMVFFARWARFFLIAKAIQKWGVQIKTFIERHTGRIFMAIGAKIAIAFAFFWALGQ